MNLRSFWIISIGILLFWSCRKETDSVTTDSGDMLAFSASDVVFDTIFSTVGSVTKSFRVHNKHDESIVISSIKLTGENSKFYRINVDGRSGTSFGDIRIPGNDSIFVFVEVTINPNDPAERLPFLVSSQIEFMTNGNIQHVELVAYGQNAIFFTPDTYVDGLPPYTIIDEINAETRWDTTLPIVIYGYAVIDEGDHLIIEPGTQIYLHANAGLWVFQNGRITVNGTKENPVVFQGDRLDEYYKDLPGSWDRIWINENTAGNDNVFNHAIIKNSFIGIQAETLPFDRIEGIAENNLILNNTIIENTQAIGLFSQNYRVLGSNLVVSNSGQYNIALLGGGIYEFTHSTIANYWSGTREDPALLAANYFSDAATGDILIYDMIIRFYNSILYGRNDEEMELDQFNDQATLDVLFHHSLIKTELDTSTFGKYVNIKLNPRNTDLFVDPFNGDFHLQNGSPPIDGADSDFPAIDPEDLDGVVRSTTMPDIGAYEFTP